MNKPTCSECNDTKQVALTLQGEGTTSPCPSCVVCKQCNDTHKMWHHRQEREVPCTHCPRPCDKCRHGGNGAYCTTTPCPCACHKGVVDDDESVKACDDENVYQPTEEHWRWAQDAYEDGFGEINVERVARLLAARDAKKIHPGALKADGKDVVAMWINDGRGWVAPPDLVAETIALRRRVAELEMSLQTVRGIADREVKTSAARLAHIRTLERFLSDHEEEEGVFIPRAEFVKPYKDDDT